MNVIDYVGWLGYSNLGDEALFLVAQNLFSPYKLNPEVLENMSSCSGVSVFGGGTLLPVWTMNSRRNNRYNYAFGVGVRNPIFWGPFNPIAIEQIKRYNFRLLGVRGNLSKNLLDSWGIPSEVVGDPALILEPTSYPKKEEKIAINVDFSMDELWGNNQVLMKEITKLCLNLKKQYELVLVPFSEEGYHSLDSLSKSTNVPIFENWTNIQSTLDLISSSKLFIGQKLHSVIFSACTFTPFISLAYRPKCIDFAESIGFEKYTIRTDQASFNNISTIFSDLTKNWDNLHLLLKENVDYYRKRIRSFSKRMLADIESLPDDKWLPLSSLERLKRKVLCGPDIFCCNHAKTNNLFQTWTKSPVNKYLVHLKTRMLC